MSATILDGKKISELLREELKKEIAGLGAQPRLGILLVGDDPASKIYVREKKKFGEYIGAKVDIFCQPGQTSARKLRKEVVRVCRLPSVAGVIVQLPLPESVGRERVLNAIEQRLDVDVLSERAFGAFALGSSPVLPPTVRAIIHLLEAYHIELKGKHAVIVGAGRLIGKPAALELMRRHITVTVADSHTQDPASLTRQADILITGTPKAAHIGADMLKEGVVVIDAGYGRTPKGKITGNVKFDEAKEIASFITPVPGGIGPLTVAALFQNLVTLAKITAEKRGTLR